MRNIFKRKELFSIRKISVGVASVIIGASMLSGVQPLGKTEVQAKENIEVEATQDVQIKVVEYEGRALIKITATKDISNVDIKITLDGQKVTTYHVDKLKAGESITKELTKAQLDRVKESLAKKIKTLPNTAVVRKSVEQTFSIDKNNLKVAVSYDIEDGTVVPNKPEVKPGEPSKPGQPDVKPEGPSKPGQPDVKPEGPSKPGNPDVKPEEPSKPEQPSNPGNPDTKPEEPSNPGTKPEVKRTKAVVEPVFVTKGTEPVLANLTFQFTNVKHPEEVVEKTTNQGTLSGEELYLDEEYKLTLKDNAGYTFNERLVKVKNLDGYMVLHDANTNESIQTLLVKEKTSGPENPGDASNQALRTKLEELTKRELRTEAGYIANQGNQIANNAWISAKTEAEKVLKNESATKEDLEAAIKNLEEKIHNATLGSEKVKVEKFIRAKNRLDLIPKLKKAKT